MTRQFDDWKRSASDADLLKTAIRFGAKLKRVGKEHVGPCPVCHGTDRFSVSTIKHAWNCRGAEGGRTAIGMVMHLRGISYLRAIEEITGEPNPNGGCGPLTPHQEAERLRRADWLREQTRAREAKQKAQEENTTRYAGLLYGESIPIKDTIGERYLNGFDLREPPGGWPECLRLHPSLSHPEGGRYAALLARVDDVDGRLIGIWREYISPKGTKAAVSTQKMGLGPVAGGAVRIGGVAEKIGCAEGVRTALGAWSLIRFGYPVWSCLSTSGLVGVELPIQVERVIIYPDSDRPMRKAGNEFVAAVPAGKKAAYTLRERLRQEGVAGTIASYPSVGLDYLDIWQARAREMANA